MSEKLDLLHMPMDALRALFEERKKALIEVRDEIDRREKDRPGVDFDFCKYVED